MKIEIEEHDIQSTILPTVVNKVKDELWEENLSDQSIELKENVENRNLSLDER